MLETPSGIHFTQDFGNSIPYLTFKESCRAMPFTIFSRRVAFLTVTIVVLSVTIPFLRSLPSPRGGSYAKKDRSLISLNVTSIGTSLDMLKKTTVSGNPRSDDRVTLMHIRREHDASVQKTLNDFEAPSATLPSSTLCLKQILLTCWKKWAMAQNMEMVRPRDLSFFALSTEMNLNGHCSSATSMT